MNELMLGNGSKEIKMNHVELCELINKLRAEEGNTKKLMTKNLLAKIRKEVETLKSLGLNNRLNFKPVEYKDNKGEMRPTYLISVKGLEWLRDVNVHDVRAYNEAIKFLDPNYNQEYIHIAPTYIRKELLIYQVLLAWFNENQIKTQYPVLDYKVDYYIPDCNLIIEYDEVSGHKDKEKDDKRMKEILNYLFEEWKNKPEIDDCDLKYFNTPEKAFYVIRIKEGEENKGLTELFELIVDIEYPHTKIKSFF